ncbi:PilZ domain-containing protein [Alteromonas facilis]|uniref:PilZ domain-containing protein n=1 Tax=Alteromonas facilis TaxID=2048004 RepID=UPI000C29328A|nr:PilZ domain-containing protein [Alteromonas facilis]
MSNQSDSNSMVHETETQRRHSRVKIPSKLTLKSQDAADQQFELLDISASGFAIKADSLEMQAGDFAEGTLTFKFDSLEIGLDVKFQIVAKYGDKDARYGCEFHELGREEISTIRTIITKFLSGEVTNVNDILTTLSRENFSKQRTDVSKALSGTDKVKAVIFTGIFVFLSLLAFSYVIFNIHQSFFVIKADTAVVSAQTSVATAQRAGNITLQVTPGQKVVKDQPLAVVESPLLVDTSNVAAAAGIEDTALNELLNKTVPSVIKSHCDCEVVELTVSNGQYVTQGQTIATFGDGSTSAVVLARFKHSDLSDIAVGTQVFIYLEPGQEPVSGVINKLEIPENIRLEEHKVHSVLATIIPAEHIPLSYLRRPVTVKIGELDALM